MNEANSTWKPLRTALVAVRWHFQRLEDAITRGIPDVNIHLPGGPDWWLELKCTVSGPVTLRPEQYVWLLKASAAGRKVGVLVRYGPRWYLFTSPARWKALRAGEHVDKTKARPWVGNGPSSVLEYLRSLG
jgi:hypothetical protein